MKNNVRKVKHFVIEKCPICKKGWMKISSEVMEPEGIEFETFLCKNCGESLMTMHQLKVLSDLHRRYRKAKEVTFAQWGNSLAVRIPRKVAEKYKLTSGKQGLLLAEKEGIRIIPQA